MAVKYPFGETENLVTANVGTVGTYATLAGEYGNDRQHTTILSLTGALPAIAGGANLAVGRLIYTLPAGNIRITNALFNNVAITQTGGNINADTPDVGLGTTIASGAVAVLSGTAAFENILTGQTFADCNGTGTKAGVASTLNILAAADHTVYLNVADGWAASGDAAAAISGTVVLSWEFLDA